MGVLGVVGLGERVGASGGDVCAAKERLRMSAVLLLLLLLLVQDGEAEGLLDRDDISFCARVPLGARLLLACRTLGGGELGPQTGHRAPV